MIAQHFPRLALARVGRAWLGLAVVAGLAGTTACVGPPFASPAPSAEPEAQAGPLGGASPVTFPTATPPPRPTASPTPWAAPFDLAFVLDGNLWLGRSDQGGLLQLTGGGQDSEPVWSPDGQRLLFGRGQGAARELFSIRADGRDLRQLTYDGVEQRWARWSPDGRQIAFEQPAGEPEQERSCELVVAGDDGARPLPIANGCNPSWSPDGGTLAFVSPPEPRPEGPPGDNGLSLAQPGVPPRPLLLVAELPTDLQPEYGLPFRPAARLLRAPDWAPSGQLLSASVDGQTGLAITLDPLAGRVRVVQANYEGAIGLTRFAPDGRLLAVESRPASGYGHLLLVEPSGRRRLDLGDERLDYSVVAPTWSPDGARLAAVVFRGPLAGASSERELLVFERSGRLARRVAQGDLGQPAWRGGR